LKHGRGFSFAEIRDAGLTPAFAQSVGIAVDHRRHNKNAEYQAANVARLNQYKSKLLLFPRHEGVAKKGIINDSTKE
jgi:large subunit ribosomal protein L13e